MLLRREDAHPSRRFFYCLRNSRQNRFALCLGNRFTLFLELLRSAQFPAKPLRALPGKTASHFSWNCF